MIDFKNELAFLKIAEKLKTILRHSWLSDGRQESVAEHSWRLALMAYRYADQLDQKVDLQRCILMATIHDIAEAITGDIPTFMAHTHSARAAKMEAELAAMHEIHALINDPHGNELIQLWHEYEAQECYESRYIRALDKLEAFIQHNEAPMSTWEGRERHMVFQDKWLRKHCRFDAFLNQFAEAVLEVAINKLIEAGEDIEQIKNEALLEEQQWEQ